MAEWRDGTEQQEGDVTVQGSEHAVPPSLLDTPGGPLLVTVGKCRQGFREQEEFEGEREK